MKIKKVVESFIYAISGIVYALKTQRNMRIHFIAAICAIYLGVYLNFTTIELLILFFTVSLVIVTELINTAIEKTIDMFTKDYHPLAKIAKNVAAASVLIAALNAIIVAYLLFLR